MIVKALSRNALSRAGVLSLSVLSLASSALAMTTVKSAPAPVRTAPARPAAPRPATVKPPTPAQRPGPQPKLPPPQRIGPPRATGPGGPGGTGKPNYTQYRGETTSKGGTAYRAPDGHVVETNKSGQVTRVSRPGFSSTLQGGKVSGIHDEAHGLTTQHAPNGLRQVETSRPDGSRVVSMGPNHGFRETPIPGRQGFVQRTYVEGGVHYSRVYRSYEYNNIRYERYVPSVVYSRRFYAWEVHPWRTAVVYQWGWQAQPWYGYYGGYFTPEAQYADAAMLLTDYIIAENLRTAYEARQESCAGCAAPAAGNDFAGSAPDSAPAAPISEQEKAQLADEVRQELSSNESGAGIPAAAGAAPEALDPKIQTFLVASNISLDAGDSTCSLTPGDMLFRVDTTVTEGKVNVRVEDSQKGDCPANTVSQLDVATLQEMHNAFRASLDQGQQVTAANEGKGGLPAGPPAGATSLADGQTTDDSEQVRSDLAAQQQMADQTEAEAQQEANQQLQPAVYTGGAALSTANQQAPALPSASPVSLIRRGQTIAQVVSIAGQPRVVKAFPPVLQVYVYDGYAVVFSNGIVASVKDHTR